MYLYQTFNLLIKIVRPMEIPAHTISTATAAASCAGYSTDIDMIAWARKDYGEDFAQYMQENHRSSDFVMRLANEAPMVLLSGAGADVAGWSVRVTLANLDDSDYDAVWIAIRSVMCRYYAAYVVQGMA